MKHNKRLNENFKIILFMIIFIFILIMLYLKSIDKKEYVKVGYSIKNFKYLDSSLDKLVTINQHEGYLLLIFTSKKCKACKIYKKRLKKKVIPFLEKIGFDYRILEIGDKVFKRESLSAMRYIITYMEYKENINENVPFTILLDKNKKIIFKYIGAVDADKIIKLVSKITNWNRINNMNALNDHIKTHGVIKQVSANDCGACCVKMILDHYKFEKELNEIKYLLTSNIDRRSTFYEMQKIFEKLNFYTEGWQSSPEKLHSFKLPLIAHYRMQHFVVVTKISKNLIGVKDPALGYREYSYKEFDKRFSGKIIIIKKKEDL